MNVRPNKEQYKKDIVTLRKTTYGSLRDCVFWYEKLEYNFEKTLIKLNELNLNKDIEKLKKDIGTKKRLIKCSVKIHPHFRLSIMFCIKCEDDFLFNTEEFRTQFINEQSLNQELSNIKMDHLELKENIFYPNEHQNIIKDVHTNIVNSLNIYIDKFIRKTRQNLSLDDVWWSLENQTLLDVKKIWLYRHFDYKSGVVIWGENITQDIFAILYKTIIMNDIVFYSWDELSVNEQSNILKHIQTSNQPNNNTTEFKKQEYNIRLQQQLLKYRKNKELLSQSYQNATIKDYLMKNNIKIIHIYIIK